MKIVFLGTPDFAVASLNILHNNGYEIAAVVTAPDKPAGRGQQIRYSAVKEYALANNIRIFQPLKLKDPDFISDLENVEADLFIVVAFRMLPEVVWTMPPLGTFNLHGSLLPQYRGAAPINWAIINGEKETGVTTFFLKHEIDTGNIIFQEKIIIRDNDTAGLLHDRMMMIGAELVLKTVKAIELTQVDVQTQAELAVEPLKHASKIFKEDCKIDWERNSRDNYNLIRGLSPYPTAFTSITNGEETFDLKIFFAEEINETSVHAGELKTDGKTFAYIGCSDGYLSLKDIQLQGKKRMGIEDFLRGFKLSNYQIK